MGKQLTVKAWKSSYNFHFCLDRSLIRKCRNLYWIETSEQQVSLQEVMHPFGWKTNAVTVWNPSLHTLYKLTLQIQQILRSTDPLEASSSTLNIVLPICSVGHLSLKWAEILMGNTPFILHYSHPTIQGLRSYPGQTDFSSLNLNVWLAVQWIIWYGALAVQWIIWYGAFFTAWPHRLRWRHLTREKGGYKIRWKRLRGEGR